MAAAQNIAILFPDTSPRGAGVPGEDAAWDFGTGAGFYLNATKPEYSKHYNMATHITEELPEVIAAAGIPIVRHQIHSRELRAFIDFVPGFHTSIDFRAQYGGPWRPYALFSI